MYNNENVMKTEFNFLVNESELKYLIQLAIHYEDMQGKGFNPFMTETVII